MFESLESRRPGAQPELVAVQHESTPVETSGSGTATLAELREFLAATEYWPGDAEVEMEYHAPRDIREAMSWRISVTAATA
jgi:hypothetical protein